MNVPILLILNMLPCLIFFPIMLSNTLQISSIGELITHEDVLQFLVSKYETRFWACVSRLQDSFENLKDTPMAKA